MRAYLYRLGLFVLLLVVIPVASGELTAQNATLMCLAATGVQLSGAQLEKGGMGWVDYLYVGLLTVGIIYCFYGGAPLWVILLLCVLSGQYSKRVYRPPRHQKPATDRHQ